MDFGPVDRITADAIGEPGARVFYLQARTGNALISIVVEKQQIQLLAASIIALLATLELETGVGPPDAELAIEEPVEPRFRAGKLTIGFDEDRDMFLLEAEEFRPEVEDDDPRSLLVDEPEVVRIWATREQMFACSRYGASVADRGRPACQFCGNPLDPEGHACPAMNGHSARD
ncbi:MAG: DUF3090 domain-containing protein [Actinomycetota bacterium]